MTEVDERGLVEIESSKIDVDDFVAKVKAGIISFPYRRYFLPSSSDLFEALKGEVARENRVLVTDSDLQTKGMPIPNKITVLYADGAGEALTDYYSEPQRARAKIVNGIYSRYQLWMSMTREVLLRCMTNYEVVNAFSLRTTIVEMGMIKVKAEIESIVEKLRAGIRLAPQANNFSSGLSMEIYRRYCPKGGSVLDTSAGWGDRALGAAASGVVSSYLGIDPNEHLFWAYGEIKANHAGEMEITILPIGSQELPFEEEESIDLVFTSPPYGDLEIYSNAPTQSSSLFSSYKTWMEKYMYPTLERSYYRLKKGRKYMLHIRDTQEQQLVLPIHEKLLSLGAKYDTVIGLVTSKSIAPVWIWEK